MARPRFLPLMTAALLFATPVFAQGDEPIDWKKGPWGDLVSTIGTYDYNTVLTYPAVKAKLDEILKGTSIDLKKEFEVSTPIGFENDCLILSGNQAKKGDTNAAYMNVCVSNESIHLAIFDSGKISIHSAAEKFQYLPTGLRIWSYLRSNPSVDVTAKPDSVSLN